MIHNTMKLAQRLLLACIWAICALPAGAQTYLDSLKTAAASEVEDTNTVVACNTLAEEVLYDDPEQGLALTRKALAISLRIRFRDGITWSHITMATAFDFADQLDSAIAHYEIAKQYKKAFADTVGMARMDLNIGAAYLDRGYYHPASEAFYRAMDVFERFKALKWLSRTYHNLGMLYRGTKRYSTALEFYKKSLMLKKELGDIKGQAYTYSNLSSMFLHAKQYEAAERSALEGFELCGKNGFWEDGALCLINAAHANLKMNKLDACHRYLQQAERLLIEEGTENSRADYLMAFAEYKQATREYQAAAAAITEAMLLFEKYGHMELLAKAYTQLSGVYKAMGRSDLALDWIYKSIDINDSLYHEDNMRQVNELQIVHKTHSKERENEALKMENRLEQVRAETSLRQRNILLVSLVVFVMLVLMILRLLWQKNHAFNQLAENKKALEVAVEQKDTLLRELHHRVKNNLQVVTGLLDLQMARIEDQEVIKALNEGKNRIRSMALIHQKLYRTDDLKSVDMQEYFEKLLQEIHSGFAIPGKEVRADIRAANISLDIDVAIPLGLIVNELVTNSFKYAFKENDTGTVRVQLDKQDDKFVLKVSDSGPGYDPVQKTGKATLGLRLVNMLVKQIRGMVEIHNFSGTEVVIQF